MQRVLIALSLVVALASAAQAQSGISFTASPDHNATFADGQQKVTSYEFRVTGAATATTNVGKPALGTNNVITVTNMGAFFSALPYGSYSAVIAAVGPGGSSASAPTPFTRAVTLTPPAPPGSAPTIIDATGQAWVTQGIGGQQGEAVFVGNQLQITSTGGVTWNAADSFWFVHQTEDGDGDLVAQVSRLDYTHVNAKGGIEFREGLTAGSRVVQFNAQPDGSLAFMHRVATNGNMALIRATAAGAVPFPSWIRLRRTGNTFTASTSPDGLTWTAFGSTSVAMAPLTHAGAMHMARQGTGAAAFARLVRQ